MVAMAVAATGIECHHHVWSLIGHHVADCGNDVAEGSAGE